MWYIPGFLDDLRESINFFRVDGNVFSSVIHYTYYGMKKEFWGGFMYISHTFSVCNFSFEYEHIHVVVTLEF